MERTKLESAARTYSHLRGLLAVPLGSLMVLAALFNWAWGPFDRAWAFVAAALVVAGVTLAVSRYYDEHFGRVTSAPRDVARTAAGSVASILLVLGVSSLLRSEAAWSLDLPVNSLAAGIASGILAYYLITIGPKAHHLAVWGTLLVAAAVPAWGGLDLSDTMNVGLVLAGLAAIVSGVLDHRLLVRTLGARTAALTAEVGDVGA